MQLNEYSSEKHFRQYIKDDFTSDEQYREYVNSHNNSKTSKDGTRNNPKPQSGKTNRLDLSKKASINSVSGVLNKNGDYSINKVITFENIRTNEDFEFAIKEYNDSQKAGAKHEYKQNIKEYSREDFTSDGQYEEYVNSENNSGRSENGTRDTSKTESGKTNLIKKSKDITQRWVDKSQKGI